MKLLVIRFSALGDVAMTAPVVKQLATARPDIDITVMSQPFCSVIFEGLAPNVHFLGADIKREYHGIKGLNKLFKRLHTMGFTHIADMHGVLRTHYLSLRFRLAGYKVAQIDKQRRDRKLITAPEGKKQLKQLTTSFDKYWRVLESLGIEPLGEAPSKVAVYNGDEAAAVINELSDGIDKDSLTEGINSISKGTNSTSEIAASTAVNTTSTTPTERFGIAPFAAHKGKIYPIEKMERVIELLVERRPGCRIYLFGGKGDEADIMLRWEERWKGSVIAASPRLKSMKKELQLMSQLRCMVSMDSANMHLASLVGTRVVSVWGATHPCAGFLGWQQSLGDCVQVDLPCRPCSIFGNKPCRRDDFACMNGITPEMIVSRMLA